MYVTPRTGVYTIYTKTNEKILIDGYFYDWLNEINWTISNKGYATYLRARLHKILQCAWG
jgi:hypothetical protein